LKDIARALLAFACVCAATSAAGQTVELARELWDRPRTGSVILSDAGIRQAVALALARPQAQIVIHHARNQEPLLQAEELRSWLGALAIDPRRIALQADVAANAPLAIEVAP
jgi:hypothetical protein